MAADSYRSHLLFVPHRTGAASRALACREALRRTREACDAKFCAVAGAPLAFARKSSQREGDRPQGLYGSTPRWHVVPARGRCLRFLLAGGTMISTHEAA